MYRWCSNSKCHLKKPLERSQTTCPLCKQLTDLEFAPGDVFKDEKRGIRFKVLQRLSEHTDAGMSTVYRVQRVDKGRLAVLKVAKQGQEEGLRREVACLQKLQSQNLRHPHIIRLNYGQNKAKPEEAILSDTQDGQTLKFIALEYMVGGSLKKKLQKRPLTLKTASHIVTKVSNALDYAHQCGIIHLDVKPSNILFDGNGRVVLSDFGIAHHLEELGRVRGRVGTPIYSPPERFDPTLKPFDQRVDVYALSLTLYEMLTQKNPIALKRSSAGVSTQVREVLTQIDQMLAQQPLHPKVPPAVENVIRKGMARDPQQRYASAGELAQALQEATLKSSPIPWLKIAAGVGIGILVALLVILTTWQQPEPVPSTSLPINGSPTPAPSVILAIASPTLLPPTVPPENPSPAIPTTLTPLPTKEVKPTSTLATFTVPTPVVTRPPKDSTPVALTGQIVLVSPPNEYTLPGQDVEFQWRWSGSKNCELLPVGYGFEILIWAENLPQSGAMDAEKEQAEIRCESEIWRFTSGNIYDAAGVKNNKATRLYWSVALVQLRPYVPLNIVAEPRFITPRR